jgi:hypothetical protein
MPPQKLSPEIINAAIDGFEAQKVFCTRGLPQCQKLKGSCTPSVQKRGTCRTPSTDCGGRAVLLRGGDPHLALRRTVNG